MIVSKTASKVFVKVEGEFRTTKKPDAKVLSGDFGMVEKVFLGRISPEAFFKALNDAPKESLNKAIFDIFAKMAKVEGMDFDKALKDGLFLVSIATSTVEPSFGFKGGYSFSNPLGSGIHAYSFEERNGKIGFFASNDEKPNREVGAVFLGIQKFLQGVIDSVDAKILGL